MSENPQQETKTPPDLIVVGDLHLGEGMLPDVPRWAPTEDFFLDNAFARFLGELQRRYADDPSRLALVLNGDILDFLTVARVPSDAEAKRRGFEIAAHERKFGLDPSAAKSVYKLDVIFAGHRPVFQALARFIGAGHRVELIRGNHDLELHFAEVRQRLLFHLASFDDGPELSAIEQRIRFHTWFYTEPGRVHIEHGNQYDSSNSTRYPLRPLLGGHRWFRKEEQEELLDYPLGSLFVRYFYNRVRTLDPYAPRLLSFDHYLNFIRRYNPFDVWRIYRDHYPHFVAALGPTTTAGSSGFSEEDDAQQERDFDRLAAENEQGDLYRKLNELKIHPASASKLGLVQQMIKPALRRVAMFAGFTFLALFLWLFILELIDALPWLTANAVLLSVFALLTVAGVFGAWIHLGRKLRARPTLALERIVERADRIAKRTGVRAVLMGHTHTVDYRKINGGQGVYLNGGTWTSVPNPWNRIMRDARRQTFLHVIGDQVRLCRWNDDAARFDPVPLFHLDEESRWHPEGVDRSVAQTPDSLRSDEHSWLPSAALREDETQPDCSDDTGVTLPEQRE